jgi:hypothetical protein
MGISLRTDLFAVTGTHTLDGAPRADALSAETAGGCTKVVLHP